MAMQSKCRVARPGRYFRGPKRKDSDGTGEEWQRESNGGGAKNADSVGEGLPRQGRDMEIQERKTT